MEPADLVITDADVYTGLGGWARGVAVKGDRIVAVTSDDEELRAHIGPRTEVIPQSGRLVIPGFQDAHIHAPFGGRNLTHVHLNDLDGREEYLVTVAHYAQSHPDDEWIIGGGWAWSSSPGATHTSRISTRSSQTVRCS